mmetsp:Transcript_18179/g.27287  ORF Transcript_18179/g.27287 Transcript_18179/m.27287 type:complete len:136 (+) Transcript_18179:543-950(+)
MITINAVASEEEMEESGVIETDMMIDVIEETDEQIVTADVIEEEILEVEAEDVDVIVAEIGMDQEKRVTDIAMRQEIERIAIVVIEEEGGTKAVMNPVGMIQVAATLAVAAAVVAAVGVTRLVFQNKVECLSVQN